MRPEMGTMPMGRDADHQQSEQQVLHRRALQRLQRLAERPRNPERHSARSRRLTTSQLSWLSTCVVPGSPETAATFNDCNVCFCAFFGVKRRPSSSSANGTSP